MHRASALLTCSATQTLLALHSVRSMWTRAFGLALTQHRLLTRCGALARSARAAHADGDVRPWTLGVWIRLHLWQARAHPLAGCKKTCRWRRRHSITMSSLAVSFSCTKITGVVIEDRRPDRYPPHWQPWQAGAHPRARCRKHVPMGKAMPERSACSLAVLRSCARALA